MRQYIHVVESLLIETSLPEHWETVETPLGSIEVGWRLAKDAINKRKHGLSLRDGIPIIAKADNPYTVQLENGYEVDKIVGRGANGQMLVTIVEWVDTTEENPAVRIISVWRATPTDLREVSMNEDADPTNPPPKAAKPTPKVGRWGDRLADKIAQQKVIHARIKIDQTPKTPDTAN